MTLEERLRSSLAAKAKPLGSLGRLEELAVWMGLVQATEQPGFDNAAILVFAADHGAAAAGVSSFPSEVTAAMVGAYLDGTAAINILARQAGARVVIVDAGVAADIPPRAGLVQAKMAAGTRDWTRGPAMPTKHVTWAVQQGGDILEQIAGTGSTVIGLGEMGIGNSSSAMLLAHKVAGLPLIAGPGAGQDRAGLARKQQLMDQAAARTGAKLPAMKALAEYGGYEIAMLTGAIMRAASLRVCVVLDGLIVTAAALLAQSMNADCLRGCVFAHRSAEPGHAAMLDHLSADPLLDLGMRLGEGTGAAMAMPLLRAASAILGEMTTLADLAGDG